MNNIRSKQLLPTILFYIVALLPLSSVTAQSSLLRSDYPDSYIVADGDTLWNIASQFLQDPQRWVDVWQPDPYLDNPDLIYPGDTLRISFVGGSPRVLVQRGDREEARLGPVIREQALASAIPAIALESIENSFTRNRIIPPELYEAAPYIVDNVGDNLAIGTGDEVYVRGQWPLGTTSFEVYRPSREYMDDTGKVVIGLEVEYLGFASITNSESDEIKRVVINNSSKEIRIGDRLLIREQSRIGATIFPTEPVNEVEGSIIAFMANEAMASQLDTVVIDLGLDDSMAVGDIQAITQEGSRLVDQVERDRMGFQERMSAIFRGKRLELPGNEIGTVLVYKVFDQHSYAVILSSLEPIELYNRVANP
jgi:hypothetical protein